MLQLPARGVPLAKRTLLLSLVSGTGSVSVSPEEYRPIGSSGDDFKCLPAVTGLVTVSPEEYGLFRPCPVSGLLVRCRGVA